MTVAVTVTAEQAPDSLPAPPEGVGASTRVTVSVLVLLMVEVRVWVVSSAGLVAEASEPDSVYIKVSLRVQSTRYQIEHIQQ